MARALAALQEYLFSANKLQGQLGEDEDAAASASAPASPKIHNHQIHGDVLEVLLSHVPLVDLVPACLVSKSWNHAVSSSLSLFNPIKPWLLIHTHSTLHTSSSSSSAIHGFDLRTHSWVRIRQPNNPPILITHSSDLQSSDSGFLYLLSPTKLSFSTDPLHLTWRHVEPPRTWRVDPLVARVGSRIVVAGGGSEYEDDPLAVEVYDTATGEQRWTTCQSMPLILKDSAAPTWLSVAADRETMFVTEKASGVTYLFSPDTGAWDGPYDIRPDPRAFFFTVGFNGADLILAGLIGTPDDVRGLKLWRIRRGRRQEDAVIGPCELIGEMPPEFVAGLKGDEGSTSVLSSISLLVAEDLVCVYNSAEPEVLVCGEYVAGSGDGTGRVGGWESVRNLAWCDERRITERMVLSVGRVGLGDVGRAVWTGNCRFEVK